MAKTIRLQPATGKYLTATTGGRTYEIWLVDPETNENGTEVLYEDAVKLLSARHPIVSLVRVKSKDGKVVKQLTEEEEAKILELRKAVKANLISSIAPEPVRSADNDTLQALVNTQAALLQTQAVQMDEMKSQFAKLQEQMADLVKSQKKSSKKVEE